MSGRQITEHFNEDELRCHCGCGRMEFTDAAVEKLEALRVQFGRPIVVNSGYRCPEYNDRISHTGRGGPHTVTKGDNITVDVKVFGRDAYRLVDLAIGHGFTGIGVNQKGAHSGRFLHLDRSPHADHPRPRVWSY